MIERCYLEITNACNLSCAFCPGHRRPPRSMSLEEFDQLTDRLQGKVRFLYFHLMGEPLLNVHLPDMVAISRRKGFLPVLTTNGTLLENTDDLLEAGLYKVQISLHSQEGNGIDDLEGYIQGVMQFSLKAADKGTIIVLRLWNQGGYEQKNAHILELLERFVPRPWHQRPDGFRLQTGLYLEYDGIFTWPDERLDADYSKEEVFCYALRNQVGVLVDGTVVPCCLDHDGSVNLGNLFERDLDEILEGERARNLYEGFSRHRAVEPLCKTCHYAAVDKRFRK